MTNDHIAVTEREHKRMNESEDRFSALILVIYGIILAFILVPEAHPATLDSRTFVKIIACESSWQEHQRGGAGESFGESFGLPQFKRETFRWMSKVAMRDQKFVQDFRDIETRISRPVFKYPSHKILVAQWAMSNGYGKKHWTCYNKFAVK